MPIASNIAATHAASLIDNHKDSMRLPVLLLSAFLPRVQLRGIILLLYSAPYLKLQNRISTVWRAPTDFSQIPGMPERRLYSYRLSKCPLPVRALGAYRREGPHLSPPAWGGEHAQ